MYSVKLIFTVISYTYINGLIRPKINNLQLVLVWHKIHVKIIPMGTSKEVISPINKVIERSILRFFIKWWSLNNCYRYNYTVLYYNGLSCILKDKQCILAKRKRTNSYNIYSTLLITEVNLNYIL